MAALRAPSPGDIGLVRIVGTEGALIRLGQFLNKITWKVWQWRKLWRVAASEHAFVSLGGTALVEAEPGGARLGDLSEFAGRTIVWLRCPPEFGPSVAAAARALLKTPYSALEYFALALRRLHIPAPWLRTYIASTKHLICSQLVVLAARRGGWDLLGREWDGYVTPEDLAELAAAAPMEGIPA